MQRPLRLTLRPPQPCDFTLTALVLRRTDQNAIDRVDADGVWSRVVFDEEPAGEDDRAALRSLVTRLFALDRDLDPFWERARRERTLADLARRCAGLRPQRLPSLATADYVMVRGLGRLGVFPRGDVGASRGRILGRAIAPGEAPAVAERFALQGMLYSCMIGDAIASARA